ncbi:MAG: hypothetical protein H5T41_03900 [Methanomassiliicoccales archaeon]|nr:hypothetical protein [Methanomassiliicoccales archaeon]
MALCSHETTIETKDNNDRTVRVNIRSSCNHVDDCVKLLTEVTMSDLCETRGSRILDSPSKLV